ncbi:hypothetical protein KUM39_24290 [Streptomyces sp. J2-1]|uniref:hypothetical protein n=1 Tax=Streptomyces corallincola TaxID=2851888 RepID=UPI001C391538|nr:hypothetical protein [Streptomyces corallincola]MBV2357446.1 hypothetical protein [Streptomyces corallincola]
MHHHAYLWTGPKSRFDQEALRRPPHPEAPPPDSRPELIQRYREVAAEFPRSGLPPLETAYWLLKPYSAVRGTWAEAEGAAAWLGERLAEYSPRIAPGASRTPHRTLVQRAVEHLRSGGDTAYGFYLERPAYLALALVTCSPNRSRPELPCPRRE